MSVDSLHVRALWPYNNGNWDELWERDTEFDDLYLQFGNSSFTGPANGGGSHSHSSTSDHTHPSPPHHHSVSAGTARNTTGVNIQQIGPKPPPTRLVSARYHSHGAISSADASITLSDESVTTQVATANVEYLRCVVLKPKTIAADIPVNGMALSDDASAPSGYDEVDGAYEGLFIRGAENGSYGGGTSSDSIHTHTANNHKHTPSSHGHAPALCGSANPGVGTGSGAIGCRGPQHHNVTLLTNSSVPDTDNEAVSIVDATYTPAFIKLLGLYNNSGKPSTPVGVCVGFVGDITGSDLPSNWSVVTAACDYQPRITLVNGDVGDTGGSNTHTHTVTDHNHSWTSHTHSNTLSWTGNANSYTGSTAALDMSGFPADNHGHRPWTVGSTTPTVSNASVTLDSVEGRPPYRTLVLIKKDSLNRKDVSNGTIYGTEDVALAA